MKHIEKKLEKGIKLPELIGGNGQQRKNKELATAFIAQHLFGVTVYNGRTGVFVAKNKEYRVSAFATDAKGAMIGTPKKPDKCIQNHPERRALMCRKHFGNGTWLWLVDDVDTHELPHNRNVRWTAVEECATTCCVISEQ